jgi:hypothetical protein
VDEARRGRAVYTFSPRLLNDSSDPTRH